MGAIETINSAPFYFELSTGTLQTNQACIESIQIGEAPRNLQQLLQLGRLVVAGETCTAAGNTRHDINDKRNLGELLVDKSTAISPGSYPCRLDVDGWTYQDYIEYGRWLLTLTQATPVKADLTERAIERASYLGIGPYQKRLAAKERFGGLRYFYEALEFTPRYARGVYETWDYERFADHVEEVFLNKPTNITLSTMLKQLALKGQGPSPHVINRLAGTLGSILDVRGYPDIPNWDENNFVSWGVEFMIINNGERPKRKHLDFLSITKKRGPSARTIFNHFDSLGLYQKRVQEEYQAKKDGIRNAVALKELPASLFEDEPTDYALVQRAAKYTLVNKLGIQMEDWHKKLTAQTHNSASFVSTIYQHSSHISEDYIKAVARAHELYDDIWTLEDAREHLRIT